MTRLANLAEVYIHAINGQMPPSSEADLRMAKAVIAFSFGVVFDSDGNIADPGKTNYDLAELIVADGVLCGLPLTLQEEVALALERVAPNHPQDIHVIESVRIPGRCKTTSEVTAEAGEHLPRLGRIAVVAFRHHLPRAVAVVRRAGHDVVVPDVRNVGDFDPDSSQPWTASLPAWRAKEPLVIAHHAVSGLI